jgi:hypothetical protein
MADTQTIVGFYLIVTSLLIFGMLKILSFILGTHLEREYSKTEEYDEYSGNLIFKLKRTERIFSKYINTDFKLKRYFRWMKLYTRLAIFILTLGVMLYLIS